MTPNIDLFGDPIPENWGRRGRPQHIATLENINKVTMLVAFGWNNERIANALGITLPTFRRHYFSLVKAQRDCARDRLDAAYAATLWKQVQAGNVGAMRLWITLVDRNDRMGVERELAASADIQAPPQRLGKKASDDIRATEVDAELTAELEREAASLNAIN
jgi:hypothetical protein